MSNLGWYQVMTTLAKKVGGPKIFMGLLFGGGGLVGVGGTCAVIDIRDRIRELKRLKEQEAAAAIVYTVNKDGKSHEGLVFKAGDTFKVLERDGDAGLVERIDDDNNPYFVSLEFLQSISDYAME